MAFLQAPDLVESLLCLQLYFRFPPPLGLMVEMAAGDSKKSDRCWGLAQASLLQAEGLSFLVSSG